ncbi:hypothetical protein D3C73_1642540 [compost metagenome]
MAGDDRLQAVGIGRQADILVEAKLHRHMIEIAAAVQIFDKPQLHLRRRQRVSLPLQRRYR